MEQNHRPSARHWQVLSHNVSSTPRHGRDTNSQCKLYYLEWHVGLFFPSLKTVIAYNGIKHGLTKNPWSGFQHNVTINSFNYLKWEYTNRIIICYIKRYHVFFIEVWNYKWLKYWLRLEISYSWRILQSWLSYRFCIRFYDPTIVLRTVTTVWYFFCFSGFQI